MAIDKKQLKSLVGKHVYVMTREGNVIDGVLQKFDHEKIYLRSRKPVHTNQFFPFFNPVTSLFLFDLLAISGTPFFFNPFFF